MWFILKGGQTISTSDYSVSIDSNKTKITITLANDYSLDLNTKYTVEIRGSKLKTSDGETVPASSASWTTAGRLC